MTSPLEIYQIVLYNDRLRIDIKAHHESIAYTSKDLIAQVQSIWPSILEHDCVNSLGSSFKSVAYYTPTAHLLEHMIIESQARAYAHDMSVKKRFFGSTHWLDKKIYLARVEVSYLHDVIALKSISEALLFLNNFALRQQSCY
ncbi:MAG: hypothetical protein IJV62_04930 [Eggerthellaceae bacterium]|nr:hypothetical protein [Eggerthellaceae bacterium]